MGSSKKRSFDANAFLDASGTAGQVVQYRPSDTIFSQGDAADTILYIQRGSVKLSVLSQNGRAAVVGVLSDGDFLGEGALADQPVHLCSCSRVTASRTDRCACCRECLRRCSRKPVGTTRSRVNFFMNKFRKLGFIDYNGGLKVHNALLSILLHDQPSHRSTTIT
jgi:cyclic nucleotide-binding protein